MAATYFLVATAAFFWGANFVLAGPVLADLPPLWAASLRFLFGAALMVGIAGLRKEDLVGMLRRHAGIYLLLGTVGIAAFNLLFFSALRTTSAANGALIMATNPLITTLIAAMVLGEKPTLRHLAAIPVALAGVLVVVTKGNFAAFSVSRGDWLMLGANFFFALYNVLGKNTCRRVPHWATHRWSWRQALACFSPLPWEAVRILPNREPGRPSRSRSWPWAEPCSPTFSGAWASCG